MILPMCSTPTLLDEFTTNYDNVYVVQTHDPNYDVIHNFKHVSGKIIVLLFLEYHQDHWIDEILCDTKNHFLKTGHLKNYYVIVHTHQYPKSIYDEYSDFFTLICEPSVYSYYVDHFTKPELSKNIKYPFLSLNNRASPARQSLYYFFKKFNLFEKSYFSYLGELERTKYASYDAITKDIASENCSAWYLKRLDLEECNKNIPYKIEGDTFHLNDWSVGQLKYYNETFCSLVFETYDNQLYPYFTEKIWKAIAFGHPFILYSNPNSLKLLQELGFKTFNDFWDEDYDTMSGNYRLESIFHLTLEIASWPIERLNKVHSQIQPILDHNQQHFFNELPKMFANVKQNLYNTIDRAIEKKIHLL
jgi:hypothetical protein